MATIHKHVNGLARRLRAQSDWQHAIDNICSDLATSEDARRRVRTILWMLAENVQMVWKDNLRLRDRVAHLVRCQNCSQTLQTHKGDDHE